MGTSFYKPPSCQRYLTIDDVTEIRTPCHESRNGTRRRT